MKGGGSGSVWCKMKTYKLHYQGSLEQNFHHSRIFLGSGTPLQSLGFSWASWSKRTSLLQEPRSSKVAKRALTMTVLHLYCDSRFCLNAGIYILYIYIYTYVYIYIWYIYIYDIYIYIYDIYIYIWYIYIYDIYIYMIYIYILYV